MSKSPLAAPRRWVIALMSIVFAGCGTSSQAVEGYNPLADFEELGPASIFTTPESQPSSDYTTEQLTWRRYLVGLLGCSSCHTDGASVGAPNPAQLLAGSSTGIACTSTFRNGTPGIVYPANLTPDMETGLGSWIMGRLITMIRVGTTEHGASSLPVMPWPAYSNIKREGARSIAAYLKSLRPVAHRVQAMSTGASLKRRRTYTLGYNSASSCAN